MNVFFTIDVELWTSPVFNTARDSIELSYNFDILGNGSQGQCGLPLQLEIFAEHELASVCFVEPLFTRYHDFSWLQRTVDLVQKYNSEVQLHIHPEWMNDLSQFPAEIFRNSAADQERLIREGCELLKRAGVKKINGFRAGNYGANEDTFSALAANAIRFDSSYNASVTTQPKPLYREDVIETPVTVFEDYPGHFRHLQLCACSFSEMQHVLWQAYHKGWKNVVIVSHSFELLRDRSPKSRDPRPDKILIKRLQKLAKFLRDNRDCFQTKGFNHLVLDQTQDEPELKSTLLRTAGRYCEQVLRRL